MRLEIQPEKCTGCRLCESFCSFFHEKAVWLTHSRIAVVAQDDSGPFILNVCRQCEEAPCAESCPMGAIVRDGHGAWMIDMGECTGCRACVEACPFDGLAFDEKQAVPLLCDLCGGEPECAAMCASGAIQVV